MGKEYSYIAGENVNWNNHFGKFLAYIKIYKATWYNNNQAVYSISHLKFLHIMSALKNFLSLKKNVYNPWWQIENKEESL